MTEISKPEDNAQKKTFKKTDENIVFVGNRPFMNYVRAVEMQFGREGCKEVTVKARGKFIARAVDIEQVVKHGPLASQITTKHIKTDSEEFVNKEGKKVKVSIVEIVLAKK